MIRLASNNPDDFDSNYMSKVPNSSSLGIPKSTNEAREMGDVALKFGIAVTCFGIILKAFFP